MAGKRKLANPHAGIAFKRPGQVSEDEDDDEDAAEADPSDGLAVAPAVTGEAQRILIHDDD